MPNWQTINHPTTLHTHNETVTHCCSPMAICDVSCRQSCHLSTPSHPRAASSVWYQNKPCYLENRVVRETCKQRTACIQLPKLYSKSISTFCELSELRKYSCGSRTSTKASKSIQNIRGGGAGRKNQGKLRSMYYLQQLQQNSAVQYTAVTGVEERRLLLLAPNSAVHRRES